MILLDGKALAEKIKRALKEERSGIKRALRLGIVLVGRDPASSAFIKQKQAFAKTIDIETRLYQYKSDISTNELRKNLAKIVHERRNTGIIVQLPLPPHFKEDYILNAITPEKDVDLLSSRAFGDFVFSRSRILPPVVGAIKALFEEYRIECKGKQAVVVGSGRLVGKPVFLWLVNQGMLTSVIPEPAKNLAEYTKMADILVSGAGAPRLIKAGMVKQGALVIDAGTSESEGKLKGDVDFEAVSSKASYITPVPGGIGPLTVAMVFRNLLTLAEEKK